MYSWDVSKRCLIHSSPPVSSRDYLALSSCSFGSCHGNDASCLPQVGKAALSLRADQTGDKDPQKVQEPALKAYRDMASDAAEFQVCTQSLSPC